MPAGEPPATDKPFDPPYELGGRCVAVAGLWERDVPCAPGYRAVRAFGRPIGVLLTSRFTELPPELGVARYREVIAASVARRGLDLAVVPFDMALDDAIPVELGREHYGLPKRLDPSMVIELGARDLWIRTAGLEAEAHAHGPLGRALGLPVRAAFALATRLVTAHVDVLGDAVPPARRARIALRPRGLGASFRASSCVADGVGLRALWCQSWEWATTWLGPPRAA